MSRSAPQLPAVQRLSSNICVTSFCYISRIPSLKWRSLFCTCYPHCPALPSRYHRMLATAYWPKSLGIIDDMDVDVLRPSMDIPVLVIYIGRLASCQGTTGNACNQVKPRPDGGAERGEWLGSKYRTICLPSGISISVLATLSFQHRSAGDRHVVRERNSG